MQLSSGTEIIKVKPGIIIKLNGKEGRFTGFNVQKKFAGFSAIGSDHNDRYGFISGVNVDLPYWGDFEVRGTLRFNAVPVTLLGGNDGSSGWLDLGLSLGYEF